MPEVTIDVSFMPFANSMSGIDAVSYTHLDVYKRQVGALARLMSQAMRRLAGCISKNGCTVIFINQLRQKIGVMSVSYTHLDVYKRQDVHEPIIERAVFEQVQQKRGKMRKRQAKDGERSMFSGLLVLSLIHI